MNSMNSMYLVIDEKTPKISKFTDETSAKFFLERSMSSLSSINRVIQNENLKMYKVEEVIENEM